MSDSFSDLWNISAPLPAKPKPQTLAAAASSPAFGQGTTSKKADVFSLLAAPSSSSSVSNINTGSGAPRSRPITPSTILRSHGSTPIPSQPTKKDNGDAFADLLSGSSTTTRSGSAGMTLAARLAMEAEENNRRHRTTTLGVQSHKSSDEAWAGLDSLEGGTIHLKTNPSNVKVDDDDDWGFGSVAQSSVSIQPKIINPKPSAFIPTTKSPSTSKTLWDLDGFSSSIRPTTTAAPPPASSSSSGSYLKTQSLPVSRSTSRLSNSSSQTHQLKVDSPDMDFDFGSREDQDQDQEPTRTHTFKSSGIGLHLLDDDEDDSDRLMDGIDHGRPQEKGFFADIDDVASGGTAVAHDEDEADILGLLSKPVEAVIAKKVFRLSVSFSFFVFFLNHLSLIIMFILLFFHFRKKWDINALSFLLEIGFRLFKNVNDPFTAYTINISTPFSTTSHPWSNCRNGIFSFTSQESTRSYG